MRAPGANGLGVHPKQGHPDPEPDAVISLKAAIVRLRVVSCGTANPVGQSFIAGCSAHRYWRIATPSVDIPIRRSARDGRKLDAQVCHVWQLSDGKVTSFQQFVDTGHLQEVMGAR